MMLLFRSILLSCLFLLPFLPGISRGDSDRGRPNVLLLLADDMRPDAISAFGNESIETPSIDRLVKQGMTFTRATCSYPICVISRAEMLTGQHGWENGVDGMQGRQFREGITFWAEAFREAGYRTGHVGKWHVSGRPADRGYDSSDGLFGSGGGRFWKEGQTDWKGFPITGYRGWVFQQEEPRTLFPERGVGLTPDISADFVDAALEWLAREPKQPWLLHLNFTAPHDPLLMPPGWEGKISAASIALPPDFLPTHPFDHGNRNGRDELLLPQPRSADDIRDLLRVYYSVIEHMDREIGRILDHLEKIGEWENTIVIFTSDHGMACGSHGLRGKQNQYEHTIGTPLILTGPGIPPRSKSPAQVYLRELYPTTCELAGIPIPESVSASSFADVLLGKTSTHHEEIYGYFTDSQRMVRTGDGWKLIHYPVSDHWQLFHLRDDPFEKENLVDSDAPEVRAILPVLRAKLLQWRKEQGDPLL